MSAPAFEYTLADAREAFLNMLADARDWHDEPDGDETGDHTTFHLIAHWQQMAELAEALGIKGPGYMESWMDALDKAIAEPAKARNVTQLHPPVDYPVGVRFVHPQTYTGSEVTFGFLLGGFLVGFIAVLVALACAWLS